MCKFGYFATLVTAEKYPTVQRSRSGEREMLLDEIEFTQNPTSPLALDDNKRISADVPKLAVIAICHIG